MKPFSRQTKEDRKPVRMTFDGSNGLEVLEWSRDENTSARFQFRPELPDEPARVLIEDGFPHWEVVKPGTTIALTPDGFLEVVEPDITTDEEITV